MFPNLPGIKSSKSKGSRKTPPDVYGDMEMTNRPILWMSCLQYWINIPGETSNNRIFGTRSSKFENGTLSVTLFLQKYLWTCANIAWSDDGEYIFLTVGYSPSFDREIWQPRTLERSTRTKSFDAYQARVFVLRGGKLRENYVVQNLRKFYQFLIFALFEYTWITCEYNLLRGQVPVDDW